VGINLIDTELISQLGMEILQLSKETSSDFGFSIIIMFGVMLAGIIIPMILLLQTENNMYAVGFFVLIIPLVIGVQVSGEQNELNAELKILKQERSDLYESQIKGAECEELRLHIVDVIENDYNYKMEGLSAWYTDKYIEDKNQWVQDLYYHKCEVPLRDEVLKLQ